MDYKLLATDMDGTLLSSENTVSKENQEWINRALEEGKHVLLCTGRCMQETEEFFPLFPKMRYVILESGGVIYDLKEKSYIYHKKIPKSQVENIFAYCKGKDIMVQVLMENKCVLSKKDYEQLAHFQMDRAEDHFSRNAVLTEDSMAFCENRAYSADKICLYHPEIEQRLITRDYMEQFPLELAFSEKTSLEISPKGIDKGFALQILCEHLGIGIEESIAVGDGYNDYAILQKAGLSVAMGNAEEDVKKICDVMVDDYDHSGVAEAIEKYLL